MLYVLVHQLSVGAAALVGVRGECNMELLDDVDLGRVRRSYNAVDEPCSDDDDGVWLRLRLVGDFERLGEAGASCISCNIQP